MTAIAELLDEGTPDRLAAVRAEAAPREAAAVFRDVPAH
jgi:hypothetical protein